MRRATLAFDFDRRFDATLAKSRAASDERAKQEAVETEIRRQLDAGVPVWAIEVLSVDRSNAPREYAVVVDRGARAYVALAARVRTLARINPALRFFMRAASRFRTGNS